MRKILLNLSLALLSLMATLFVLELLLRLVDKPKWTQHFRVGWKYRGTDTHINQIGYRGQPIEYSEDDLVVVLVGDSQLEAGACPFDSIPEQLLQRHLRKFDPRFKVFSLGSLGYGTDQELLALQEYFKEFRADLVVLWQTFDNDVWNNMFPTNMPEDGTMKPTFRLQEDRLIGPNHNLLDTIIRPPTTKLELLWQRIVHPQNGLDASWEKYLPQAYQPIKNFTGEYRTDWDPKANPVRLMENLNNEKSHLTVYLTPKSPRTQYGLDLTRLLLNRIDSLCRANKSAFNIFYLQEDMVMVGTKSFTQKIADNYYMASQEQCQSNQNYVNADFKVYGIPIPMENWQVSEKDNRHLNCAANDHVMNSLGDSIISGTDFLIPGTSEALNQLSSQ